MLDVLKFVFQDIWHFLGTLLLIYILGEAIHEIVTPERSKRAD